MPYWGQEMYRLHNEAAYVSNYSTSAVYKQNASKFTQMWQGTMFETVVEGKSYNDVTIAMIPQENKKQVSALEYFNGLAEGISKSEWEKDFIPQ